MSEKFFTSESVTEGHPDKMCDQISDAVLDAILAQDPHARVACNATVSTGLVHVFGQITTSAHVDITAVVRDVLCGIGYTGDQCGLNGKTCAVLVGLDKQSPDISAGVSTSLETRQGSTDRLDQLGAGDQGLMFGFACNETPELMPLSIILAHRMARKLAAVRKNDDLPYLRPDGKTAVTVEYSGDEVRRVDAVVIACHHAAGISLERLTRDIMEQVVKAVVPPGLLDERTRFYLNAAGPFVVGGPQADSGLTGKKIIVDTYGGHARHGGGSFSGKDATKVDRSATYAARYVAKNIVAARLADRCEVQLSYVIGKAAPISIRVDSFGTNRIPETEIEQLVRSHFDLRPTAIIEAFGLRRPIFLPLATYGHFGRDDLDLPWEATDKANLLRQESGQVSV